MKYVIIDTTHRVTTSRQLAQEIEEEVKKTQVSVTKTMPMLPNLIIMTPKQFRDLRKARKIKNIGFGNIYMTKYNVMEVQVRDVQ